MHSAETHTRVAMTLLGRAVMLLAWFFFLFDIINDLVSLSNGSGFKSAGGLVHQSFEGFAFIGLTLGLFFMFSNLRALKRIKTRQAEQIHQYRSCFSETLKNTFAQWDLTPAECDVAILVLRGLPNSTIARARNTSLSTTKGQLHSIFCKAGVDTRNQFMSKIMDRIFKGDATVPKNETLPEDASEGKGNLASDTGLG